MKVTIYQDACPITGQKRTWMKKEEMNFLRHCSRLVAPCGEFDCTMQYAVDDDGNNVNVCDDCIHRYSPEDVMVEIRDWDGSLVGAILKMKPQWTCEEITMEFVPRVRFSAKAIAMAVAAEISMAGCPVGEGENPGYLRDDWNIGLRRLKIKDTAGIVAPENRRLPMTSSLAQALFVAKKRQELMRKRTFSMKPEVMERLSAELLRAPHEPGYLAHRAYAPNRWRSCGETGKWEIYKPYEARCLVMHRNRHDSAEGRFFWSYTETGDLKWVRELTSWGEDITFYPREGKVEVLMWADSPAWAIVQKYI